MKKGYDIFTSDSSEIYIPGALHIEKLDELDLFKNDTQASKQAERDGIKLIYGMEGVLDGTYIDTEENRETIIKILEQYPKYKEII